MVAEEALRTQSVVDARSSQFLVRTSHIFQKVSHFRGSRHKSEGKGQPGKYTRSTRSMDMGSKPYLDVGTHHSMELERDSSTPSSNDHASALGVASTSQTGLVELEATHRRTVSGGTLPAHTRPIPDGLPRSQQLSRMFGKQDEARAGEAQQPVISPVRENAQPTNAHYHSPARRNVGVAASSVPSDAESHRMLDPQSSNGLPLSVECSQAVVEVRKDRPPPPLIEKDIGVPSRPTISHFREPAHTGTREEYPDGFTESSPSPRPVHSVPSIALSQARTPSEGATERPLRMHGGQASEGLLLSFGKRETQDHTTLTLPSRKLTLSEASALISDGAHPLSERRSLAPRLATLPLPMMARYNASGAARLTPSIVTRPPPMPIFNLPTLSPTSPDVRPRTQAPLRSIPALPMQGPSEQDGDHENSELADSDEEDDGEDTDNTSLMAREGDGAASDEEDIEDSSEIAHGRPAVGPRTLLPRMRTSGGFASAEAAEPRPSTIYHTPSADFQPTPLAHPAAGSSVDYFSAKDAGRQSPTRTPRPSDFPGGGAARTPSLGNGSLLTPMLQGSPRPGLYHHGSKSMVDLSISRKGNDVMGPPARGGGDIVLERRRSRVMREGPPTIVEDEHATPRLPGEIPEEPASGTPTLRRQRSLPTYTAASEPPPYPSFHPRAGFNVQPRDEEGFEWLPSYSNAIHLAAVMPIKLEFLQPGVQARDRKWRRVLCVLEGTAFKVFKCPPSVAGVSAIEQWWERKVGVGDIATSATMVTGSGVRVSAMGRRRDADRPSKPTESDSPASPLLQAMLQEGSSRSGPSAPTRSKLRGLLRPTRSSFSSSRTRPPVDIQRDDRRLPSPPISTRQSSDANSSRSVLSSGYASYSTSGTALTTPSPTNDSASFFSRSRRHSSFGSEPSASSTKELLEPDPKDLVRCYTLQRAESGLASDYLKRKNVIRVRMEGEQFLLQAKDVAAVIDWIENIQAATNIALDLDERPMPRGPMFPRRRRRRARPVEEHDTTRSLTIAAQARIASG